jgi:hypothetical protein
VRPEIVGAALQKISADDDVVKALFEILETEKVLESKAKVTLVPEGSGLLNQLLAAQTAQSD